MQVRTHLAVRAGLDNLPGLEVHIIAVQLIGQCIVRCTPKHIEMAVKGHHGVSIAPLWRGWGTPEQVLSRDACPPGAMTMNRHWSLTHSPQKGLL